MLLLFPTYAAARGLQIVLVQNGHVYVRAVQYAIYEHADADPNQE